jgi:hypothetical protein
MTWRRHHPVPGSAWNILPSITLRRRGRAARAEWESEFACPPHRGAPGRHVTTALQNERRAQVRVQAR